MTPPTTTRPREISEIMAKLAEVRRQKRGYPRLPSGVLA
jgi:hypothetical protein